MRCQRLAERDDADWTRLDAAVGQLEESWRTSSDATLGQLVPPCGDPLRDPVLIQLIKIDQEYRWRAGRRKLLEAYLADWPELSNRSQAVVELLEAECRTRAILEGLPAAEELQSRFPQVAGQVDLVSIANSAEREGGQSSPDPNWEAPGTPDDSMGSTPSQRGGTLAPGASRLRGRYEIRAVLGQGGMGTVYRAYDTRLEREVALKVPSIDPTDEPAVLERFLREAKTMARIRHPNICQVFDAGQSHGTYYMAMALIEGQPLAAWMKDRVVDSHEAAELLYKLAHALAIVHAAGVVHRDLKPQNVMIDQSGEPLVMDFGLARPVQADSPLTGTHSVLGTPAYMSSEQVNGEPASEQSDIYSLGVIFYQVLTGRLPFTGPLAKLSASIVKGDPPRPRKLRPNVDPDLEAICLKAMARQPADRYQSAKDMAEALGAYLEGSPQPTNRPARHRRWWRVATAAAAPLLVVAGVIIYLKTDKGTLVLDVNPPDVRVTIDGSQVRIKSPHDEIAVAVGSHQLEVTKDGFHTHTDSFTIRRGGKVEILARLEPLRTAKSPDGPPGAMVSIEMVTVGDPGNAPDTRHGRGYGAVPYTYSIGKYEVTAGQYTKFLSAVAAADIYGLYDPGMWSAKDGCKIERTGEPGRYTYSIASDLANRPVNYVSFWDACRFCNWLHNGQKSGPQDATTTEDGAYTLNGFDANGGGAIRRNPGAKWVIPTEDEWHKAAYYKGGGPDAGYWNYPTQSDLPPTPEPPPGGRNSANHRFAVGSTTVVGAYANSASAYGTFDQAGNLWEWNETVVWGANRGMRGGWCCEETAIDGLVASCRADGANPAFGGGPFGFRVASMAETGQTKRASRGQEPQATVPPRPPRVAPPPEALPPPWVPPPGRRPRP